MATIKIVHSTGIFTYIELLSKREQKKIPQSVTLNRPAVETILFRLLLGTLDISHKYENKKIPQRINYSKLGTENVEKVKQEIISDYFSDITTDTRIIDSYFMKNRSNTSFFEDLLSEISNYFYQKDKKAYLSAFVHLYRTLEHLSYAFPLLYVKHSNSYKGTFSSMQSFFSSDAQASELKFVQELQKVLFTPNILKNGLTTFTIVGPDDNIKNNIKAAIESLLNGLQYSVNDFDVSIYNKNLVTFIIRLRNRYFHFLLGSEKNNLDSKSIVVDSLFESVNEQIINWIAFMYFEILKKGLRG